MITACVCVCVYFTHVRSYRSPTNDYNIICSHNALNYTTLLGLQFECTSTHLLNGCKQSARELGILLEIFIRSVWWEKTFEYYHQDRLRNGHLTYTHSHIANSWFSTRRRHYNIGVAREVYILCIRALETISSVKRGAFHLIYVYFTICIQWKRDDYRNDRNDVQKSTRIRKNVVLYPCYSVWARIT